MHPDIERFLNLRTLPARVTAEQAAKYLGFSPHEIPVLVARGLLKPLGHPAPNTVKFFAAVTLKELWQDVKWLAKASDVMREHWRVKNAHRSNGEPLATTPRYQGPRPNVETS